MEGLKVLKSVLTTLCQKFSHIKIGVDANSRHPIWDLSSIGMQQSTPSIKRGNEIEEMVRGHRNEILVSLNGFWPLRS